MENRVEKLITLLDCSEEQAKSIIEYDQKVDKMTVKECESDLTDDQKAVAKKYRQGDRKPTIYKLETRERKADNDKREIIQVLDDALCDLVDNVIVTNAERQLDFEFNGRKFRIVLSAPRK